MSAAAALLAELREHASDDERAKIRRHFPHDDPVIGVRRRTTFDTAKRYAAMPLPEVDKLFDRPEYEARLSAVCVLDFKARAADADRRALYDRYLARHDRINWPPRSNSDQCTMLWSRSAKARIDRKSLANTATPVGTVPRGVSSMDLCASS